VLAFDIGKLSLSENLAIKMREGEPVTFDETSQSPTVTLKCKCPVDPNRAHILDSICNMEKGMDGRWACRKAVVQVLVV
jgi:hypothetical protein